MRFLLPWLMLGATSVSAAPIAVDPLKADVRELASDAYEGRVPGTPGEDRTIAYLIGRMQAIGLQPGNHGQWTQEVPLASVAIAADTPVTVSGRGAPLALAMNRDVAIATRRQQDVAVAAPLVFVGHGIVAPELGWNDYAGLDVRGKVVVVLVNDPDWRAKAAGRDAGRFEGRAMTYYGRYTYKFEEARRQGASGVLVVHADEPAGYPWAVIGTNVGRPAIGLDSADAGASELAFQGWVSHDAAARLLAAAGLDLAAQEQAATQPGFRGADLGLMLTMSLAPRVVKSRSRNVLGIVPGTAQPDEVVLFSAHWDHVGRCQPVNGDDLCNGAIDNASGTAGLLALAADFAAGPKLARSVLFVAVTAEEPGLLGSQYYAEHPVYPLAKTVGGINMDGLAVAGRYDGVTLLGAGKSELEPLMARLAAAQGRRLVAENSPEQGGYFRSDHFSLAKLGVPMLFPQSGGELVGKPAGSAAAAAADYTANRYHRPDDEYDPNWDWSGAVQDLELYAAFGRELASGSAWPNWYPDSQFRRIRDRSRPQ